MPHRWEPTFKQTLFQVYLCSAEGSTGARLYYFSARQRMAAFKVLQRFTRPLDCKYGLHIAGYAMEL